MRDVHGVWCGVWLALASASAACADDPRFVASDATATTTDTTATETTTSRDTTDATSSTSDPDAEVGPGCGDGCGPLAECREERCACVEADCDGEIAAAYVASVSSTVDAARRLRLSVARWDPEGLSHFQWDGASFVEEPDIAPWPGNAHQVVAGADGTPYIVQLVDQMIALATPGVDAWPYFETSVGPCHAALPAVDPSSGALVVGCLEPATDALRWHTWRPDEERLERDDGQALPVGAAAGPPVWTFAASGTAWAAWFGAPARDGTRTVYLAHRTGPAWITEVVAEGVTPRALALVIDRADQPHVLFSHEQGDDGVVTHGYYEDAFHLTTSEVDRKTSPNAFAPQLAASPAPGTALDVVYTSDTRIVHVTVDGADVGPPHVLDVVVGTASHVSAAPTERDACAVVYLKGADGAVHLWLPRGP